MFGTDCDAVKEKRLVTCQTLSGTGALTVAAHFFKWVALSRHQQCVHP
jgi:aspartate/tyrosine/aromatic aminotransferase